MYFKLAPQKVRHSTGYIVQIASRCRVELIETDGSVVSIDVEFGRVSTLYSESIVKNDAKGLSVPINESQKHSLIDQIKCGLEAMGGVYEIV